MKRNLDKSTREHILKKTMDLLFSTMPEKLTSRGISEASGVNVAAINYYFQSKDKLVDEAVETGTEIAFRKGMEILMTEGNDPRKRLSDFLTGYAHGSMEYPRLTRAAFNNLFLKEAESNPFGRYSKEMIENIGKVIGEASGSTDQEKNKNKALMMVGSVIFPFLIPKTLLESGIIDYGNAEKRNIYIDDMIDLLMENYIKETGHA